MDKFDLFCGIMAYLILGAIILGIGYGVYWFFFLHEHIETQIETTVVGLTSQSVGGSVLGGSGSKSICILETDEGERYRTAKTCYFVVDDRVTIHFHDGVQKYERLLEPAK